MSNKSITSPERDNLHAGAPGLAPPLHPYLVLAAAIILPAAGQVLNRTPKRALIMIFFMLSLGMVTYQLTPPERSFVGRHAGGVFVYAIAVLDAYRWARYRAALYRRQTYPIA
jgi:hypothetical protein